MEQALVISSQLINLNKVRVFLEDVYKKSCLNRSSFNHVFLGISEAVNNSIIHGNKSDPEKLVTIRINLVGKQLRIEVEDEGDGFNEEVLVNPTIPEHIKCEHGRGIFIIRQFADALEFKEGGRKVNILFTIPE